MKKFKSERSEAQPLTGGSSVTVTDTHEAVRTLEAEGHRSTFVFQLISSLEDQVAEREATIDSKTREVKGEKG